MNTINLKHTILIALLCIGLLPEAVVASPLSDARDAGLVSELPTGYVAAKGKVSAEIQVLIKDINSRRLAAYTKISKGTKLTVEQVGRESYLKRQQ